VKYRWTGFSICRKTGGEGTFQPNRIPSGKKALKSVSCRSALRPPAPSCLVASLSHTYTLRPHDFTIRPPPPPPGAAHILGVQHGHAVSALDGIQIFEEPEQVEVAEAGSDQPADGRLQSSPGREGGKG
jgi:hypothetical protein